MKNVLAIHIENNTLSDTAGRAVTPNSLSELLDFLLSADLPDTFIVVWNCFELIEQIKRFITEAEYQTLTTKDRVWVGESGNRYKLFSVEGKRLSIGHEYREHTTGNFYQASKKEVDIFNLCRYFPNYRPQSAADISTKGMELLASLDAMGMGDTKTLASGIAIFHDTLMQDVFSPHLYEMPDTALDAAEYVIPLLTREWRAVYKVGHWPNSAWDIDQRAAYPALVANFGDLSDCTIWHTKQYQKCDWGVFKGKLTIEANINPIINSNKRPIKGSYEDVITTDQWAFLNKYRVGHFEPKDGWCIKYNSDFKPFYGIMHHFYSKRDEGGLVKDIAKAVSVGFIGCFAEKYDSQDNPANDKRGKQYNPFYSVMATSRCALKVGKMIYDNALTDNLISVTVDGALVDKEVNFPEDKNMGAWRSERVNAIVLSVGHSYVGDKHPQNHTYDDMLKAMQANRKAMIFNDVILNKEMQTTNRDFKEYPASAGDVLSKVYDSHPLDIGIIEKGGLENGKI